MLKGLPPSTNGANATQDQATPPTDSKLTEVSTSWQDIEAQPLRAHSEDPFLHQERAAVSGNSALFAIGLQASWKPTDAPQEQGALCTNAELIKRPGLSAERAVLCLEAQGALKVEIPVGRPLERNTEQGPAQGRVVKTQWVQKRVPDDRGIVHRRGHLTIDSDFDAQHPGGVQLLKIPTAIATPESLEGWGARLIEPGQTPELLKRRYALVPFTYGDNYLSEHVMQKEGGGGPMLERHDFPHLEIPTEDQSGYIVLGRKTADKELELCAFQVPTGHAMWIDSMTLHTNDYMLGRWVTGLGQASTEIHYRVLQPGGEPGDLNKSVILSPDDDNFAPVRKFMAS